MGVGGVSGTIIHEYWYIDTNISSVLTLCFDESLGTQNQTKSTTELIPASHKPLRHCLDGALCQ
jgi:hypothetical protein